MVKTRKNTISSLNKNKSNKSNKTTSKKTKSNKVYSTDEYKSSDGMLVSVWGPSIWHSLHTMSFNYPVKPSIEDKTHYRNFIINLQHVLPCKYCRINLKTNLKQLPLKMSHMKDRDSFSKYVYDLHELVNKMLNKKSGLEYCDVRERYEHFRARCTEEKPKIFKFTKKNMTQKNKKSEKGCTEPLYGKKSRCIIKIVPQDVKGSTFQMDKKCIKTRGL